MTRRRVVLTQREVQVLTGVMHGKTNQEIGDSLYLSKRTIDFHLVAIFYKLQAKNRILALREAWKYGLLPFDPNCLTDQHY